MSLIDRRRHPRFPFHSRGRLSIGSIDLSGTLLDISLSGGLFATDVALELQAGQACGLTALHGAQMAFQTQAGRVAHLHGNVVGIEFVDVGEDMKQALRHLVDLNLGLPRLLDRDIPALLTSR